MSFPEIAVISTVSLPRISNSVVAITIISPTTQLVKSEFTVRESSPISIVLSS